MHLSVSVMETTLPPHHNSLSYLLYIHNDYEKDNYLILISILFNIDVSIKVHLICLKTAQVI